MTIREAMERMNHNAYLLGLGGPLEMHKTIGPLAGNTSAEQLQDGIAKQMPGVQVTSSGTGTFTLEFVGDTRPRWQKLWGRYRLPGACLLVGLVVGIVIGRYWA